MRISATTLLCFGMFAFGSCAAQKSSLESAQNASAQQPPFDLDAAIYATSNLSFESVSGNDYLSMNVPYAPAHKIDVELMRRLGKTLRDRNEAHITVITPPEYQSISAQISMTEIKPLAKSLNLQSSKFEVRCLGRGQIKGNLETYYLVVVSDDLVTFREAIEKRVKAGGGTFDAEHFYPHITIGFTQRDLHEADGVIKDEASCIAKPKGART